MKHDYVPPLDAGIEKAVRTLREAGVNTYESCEGGAGHSYPEPTVRFHGGYPEAICALGVALYHRFPVSCIREVWDVLDGRIFESPTWEMVFYEKVPLTERDFQQEPELMTAPTLP